MRCLTLTHVSATVSTTDSELPSKRSLSSRRDILRGRLVRISPPLRRADTAFRCAVLLKHLFGLAFVFASAIAAAVAAAVVVIVVIALAVVAVAPSSSSPPPL